MLRAFEDCDYVVVPSGSCRRMLRHHLPHLLDDDPNPRARADALSGRTWKLVAFLIDVMGVQPADVAGGGAGYAGVATYRDSCSGLRELGLKAQPRALLRGIAGLKLREMTDPDVCCGLAAPSA